MASRKLVFFLTVVFPLIFFVSPASSQKVNVSIYYGSLCQPCAHFIVQNLSSIFDDGLVSIINLRMVPWGNATVNSVNGTVVCQHGPDECLLNTIQACAISFLNDVDKIYALIQCTEFKAIDGTPKDWQTCFDQLGLPKQPALKCYSSGNGTKLSAANGDETGHLNPPPKFFPWILANNQPINGADYQNLKIHVCNAYKGDVIPKACSSARKGTRYDSPSMLQNITNT